MRRRARCVTSAQSRPFAIQPPTPLSSPASTPVSIPAPALQCYVRYRQSHAFDTAAVLALLHLLVTDTVLAFNMVYAIVVPMEPTITVLAVPSSPLVHAAAIGSKDGYSRLKWGVRRLLWKINE